MKRIMLLMILSLILAGSGSAQLTVKNSDDRVVMYIDENANMTLGSAHETGDLNTDNIVISDGLTFAPAQAEAGRVLKTNDNGEAFWGLENQRLRMGGEGANIEITDGMGNTVNSVTLPPIPSLWQLSGTQGDLSLIPSDLSYRVGIGTSDVNADLDIVSDGYATIRLEGKTGYDEVAMFRAGNGNTRFHASGAMVFFVDNDNNSGGGGQFTIFAHDNEIYGDTATRLFWVGHGDPQWTRYLSLGNGAHCTAGGAWVDGSSREYKKNISPLSLKAAHKTLSQLRPVTFNYKTVSDPDQYVGFIAEDVPELVATHDRKSMSPMDVVGVLTRVVQDQEKRIQQLESLLTQYTQ